MRANCESIQRTSHCIRFQVILREASFSVTDTGFTNETDWISESGVGDISCRSLVWDVVLGDFQPERTSPRLVLSEVFGIRPTSGWRTLPGGSTCSFFFAERLGVSQKIQDVYKFSPPRNHLIFGTCQDEKLSDLDQTAPIGGHSTGRCGIGLCR